MKEYRIIKTANLWGIANKEDINKYWHCHFLPLVVAMKKKKSLIFIIENNKHYEFLKNNTEYKTAYID